MSNQIIALTALLIALASSLGNAASAADTAPADKPADNSAPTSGIQPAWIDNSVRPQDDLFTHANGSWLKTTQIPADRSWYGEAGEMGDRSLEQQHQILEAAKTATDAQERKVGDLYASFMNTAVIEDRGIAPLQPTLDAVAAVRGRAQLSALMGDFYRNALPSPIAAEIDPDHKDSTRYSFVMSQGGIGLPNRDYFLSKDAKLQQFKAAYRKHIEATLRLLGDSDASAAADHILTLETALARIQWTTVQNRDPNKIYNPKTLAELAALAPAIDWNAYFAHANIPADKTILVVNQPSYLRGLEQLISQTPLDTWKQYFRYHVVSSRSRYLPQRFVDEDFAFREGVLTGTPEQQERWKRGVELVDESMGEESGKLYVAKYFPPETKARVDELVDNLISAYRSSIDHLVWMSPSTRAEAHAKLDAITRKIGYPAKWRDYSALTISADDLLGNVTRANRFEQDRKAAQLLGPVDRSEWDMTAPTVNAYYSPELNEVVFPAGILQTPAFDARADDAYNYGSTGATIGHELSHAFDDEGSQFDAHGNLRNWWTKEDHAKFKELTAKLIKEFNGFEPVKGFHVNGAQTLGENIADIAGIEIAHKAYLATLHGQAAPVIDGLTGDQRFYLGFAQSWLGKEREAALIAQLKSDPHSPEKYRVNGVVVHMPRFYDAFGVTAKDKMWLAPSDRVTLW